MPINPITLARAIMVQPVDHPAQALLSRDFASLGTADKIACRREIEEIKAAKRGERLAVIRIVRVA